MSEYLYEWREQIGVRIMHAMTCTHHGSDDFGDKAVCVTCFDNTQKVGALIEAAAANAWDQGRAAERRDWELTADLVTPDEERRPLPNPYRQPLTTDECADVEHRDEAPWRETVAEALEGRYIVFNDESSERVMMLPSEAELIADALAPTIERLLTEARAEALREAATSLGHIHQADSAGASACIRWLRDRAASILRTAAQPATSPEEGR